MSKQETATLEFTEEVVREVRRDFEARYEVRRQFEAQWQLNTNFVLGNQYAYITPAMELGDGGREYFWQEREVYNHIASIVESRLAKLGRIRPKMAVIPASGDDNDIKTAKTAGKILDSAYNRLELDHILSRGTHWSELTGSVFYKVTWDGNAGKTVGEKDGNPVKEGDVRVDVCPPYEIFPDHLSAESAEHTGSIIHARAVTVAEIQRRYGVEVKPEAVDLVTQSGAGVIGGLSGTTVTAAVARRGADGHALVIERYSLPTSEKPDGELLIVAGQSLLYSGPLPYLNGTDGERALPFVQQNAITRAGCFFGTSMVERAIPVQRAYNAVKNRKHEFMNRIAMGVLAVEDGSVDTDNLEEEGLSPGKILVYRQGSTPPRFFNPGSVPAEFSIEEQRLLNEFIDISGISEIMRSSSVPSSVTSGVAIQMLVDQDDTRISVTADEIRRAMRKIAQHILRLYRQFATAPRLFRFVGSEGEIELLSFTKNDITSDDIRFETGNEASSTAASRQAMLFDLLRLGLLNDENGRLSDEMRYKVLNVFGYGGWEHTQNVKAMHIRNAEKENLSLKAGGEAEVLEVDDHTLHAAEHSRYMLSSEFAALAKRKPALKETFLEHLRTHKQFGKLTQEMDKAAEGGETA